MTYMDRMQDLYADALAVEDLEDIKGVSWGSDGSQKGHFGNLLGLINTYDWSDDISICDAGCGVGDLLGYWHRSRYLGIDMFPEMIAKAKRKYPNWNFEVCDILTDMGANTVRDAITADYFIASGTLYHMTDEELLLALTNLWVSCRKGVIFNLSTDSHPLMYDLWQFLNVLTHNITIKQNSRHWYYVALYK